MDKFMLINLNNIKSDIQYKLLEVKSLPSLTITLHLSKFNEKPHLHKARYFRMHPNYKAPSMFKSMQHITYFLKKQQPYYK